MQSLLGVPTPQEVRKATAASNAMVLSLSLPVFRSWLCSDSIVASSLNEKQCMVEAFRQVSCPDGWRAAQEYIRAPPYTF